MLLLVNGGGGNSKLGRVGAAGRRVFKDWADSSSPDPIAGVGLTARVARVEFSRAKSSSGMAEEAAPGGRGYEEAGCRDQSRPSGRTPEGLEGSRRGGVDRGGLRSIRGRSYRIQVSV